MAQKHFLGASWALQETMSHRTPYFVISTGNNHQHIFKTLPPFYPTVSSPQGHLLSLDTSALCSLPQWSGVYSRWRHEEPFPVGSLSLVLLALPRSALPPPKPQASSSELSVLPRTTVLKGTSRGPSEVGRRDLSPCLWQYLAGALPPPQRDASACYWPKHQSMSQAV